MNPYQNNPYENNPYQQQPNLYQQYPQTNNMPNYQQYPSTNNMPNYQQYPSNVPSYQQYAQNEPSSLMEFQLSCDVESKLINTAKKFKLMINEDERGWKLVGETEELVGHQLQFSKSFKIKFHFERKQLIKVSLYENKTEIGCVSTELSNIVSQQGQFLKSKIDSGSITIFSEEVYQPPSWAGMNDKSQDFSNWV